MPMNRDLYKYFSKPQLVLVCKELGVEISVTDPSKSISDKLLDDMLENGVPENDQCSPLLIKMLKSAGIMNEKGELVEVVDEEVAEEIPTQEVESMLEESVTESVPDCYGFEDDRDPACQQCKYKEKCKVQRVNNRPPCYGKLYDETSDECKICIEASECKERKE